MAGGGGVYSRERTLSNAKVFLAGKVGSACLTVVWLAMLVRMLAIEDYAVYVAGIALIEAGLVVSALGVEWLLIRYVPEYVVHGAQASLKLLILRAFALRIFGGLLVVGLGIGFFHIWPQTISEANAKVLPLLGLLLLSEACMRLLRDSALESMGQQGLTQFGVMLRTALVIAASYFFYAGDGRIGVHSVLVIELTASLLVLLYSVVAVHHALGRMNSVRGVGAGENWTAPKFSLLFKSGLNNYASNLINFPLSLQAMILMVSALGGSANATASFGFMIRILEIMRGYLPALMLMSVLRPRFIGLYAQTHTLVKVAREAALASRLSALTVAPLIGIIALYGDQLLLLASGGKIFSGRWILAGLTLTLMVRVHRQITVVLINCVELSRLFLIAAGVSLFVLPLAWLIALQGGVQALAWRNHASGQVR